MSAPDALPHVLLALPVMILSCRVGGAVMRRIGQPPVIGEIVTGILLGPSLLGWLWPQAHALLAAPELSAHLNVLGQLGLLCFMFLIGLELDLGSLRGNNRTVVAVSQASIALPLALGALLALAMNGTLAPPGIGRLPFVLFISVAMSITAFPVLARILTGRGLHNSALGAVAMACAAVNDIVAWCLLAAVVAIVQGGSALDSLTTAAMTAGLVAVMVYTVKPLLARWTASAPVHRAGGDTMVLVALFSGMCLSALATDAIGVHALFGAFLFGAVAPRGSAQVERSAARLRAVTVPVLLPLFFVSSGMHTDVGTLNDPVMWLWASAGIVVATVSKYTGTAVTARLCGRSWHEASTLGVLMNCRGLTELVVLNIGLTLGVIGEDVFTLLVLMALVTTAVTSPLLTLLDRRAARSMPATLPADTKRTELTPR